MLEHRYSQGFSLLEVIVVTAIFGLLLAIGAPIYRTMQSQNEFILTLQTFKSVAARTQLLSQSGSGDSAWGLKATQGKLVVFKGVDFVARDSSFDESYNLGTNVRFSGSNEMVFNKMTGYLNSPVLLNVAVSGFNKDININIKGIVSY